MSFLLSIHTEHVKKILLECDGEYVHEMEITSSKTAEWVFEDLGLAEEEESHLDHGSITNTIVSWINRTLDIDCPIHPIAWTGRPPVTISEMSRNLSMPLKS